MSKTADAYMELAEDFFYEYAGWGYHPDHETPEQGRRRSAASLALAEGMARALGYDFGWEYDGSVLSHVREFDAYDEEPETCEVCYMNTVHGRTVNSMGCIDDATPEYRRVIEAELALDYLTERGMM